MDDCHHLNPNNLTCHDAEQEEEKPQGYSNDAQYLDSLGGLVDSIIIEICSLIIIRDNSNCSGIKLPTNNAQHGQINPKTNLLMLQIPTVANDGIEVPILVVD